MSLSPSQRPRLKLHNATLQDNAFFARVFESVEPLYASIAPGSMAANAENMRRLTQRGLDFQATGLSGYVLTQTTGAQPLPVGIAGIGPLSPRKAYMAALHLLPEYRRQGLGSEALKLLEAHYQNLKFQEMLLLAHRQAQWAIQFYSQHAYREISDQLESIVRYGGEPLRHLYEPGMILLARKLN